MVRSQPANLTKRRSSPTTDDSALFVISLVMEAGIVSGLSLCQDRNGQYKLWRCEFTQAKPHLSALTFKRASISHTTTVRYSRGG
jgi:hypothetical protein